MVKNTSGGNKSKGVARKNFTKKESAVRLAHENGEIYAQAVKIMGGKIVSAIDIHGNPLQGHIRGKFSGRGKRDNFIGPNVWLLVGLHSWEDSAIKSGVVRNCDVLEVYSDSDKIRLKNSLTAINWSIFIANDMKQINNEGGKDDGDIEFTDDITQEYENIISSQATEEYKKNIITDECFINVDDI